MDPREEHELSYQSALVRCLSSSALDPVCVSWDLRCWVLCLEVAAKHQVCASAEQQDGELD